MELFCELGINKRQSIGSLFCTFSVHLKLTTYYLTSRSASYGLPSTTILITELTMDFTKQKRTFLPEYSPFKLTCLTTWKMILNDSSRFLTLLTKHLRNGNLEISFRVTVFTLAFKPVNISVNARDIMVSPASMVLNS